MIRFILGKLLYLVPTFLGITFVAFAFVRVLPGDPVLLMAGERGISPERHAQLAEQLGFSQPVWQQYLHFLGRLLQGDLGNSRWSPRSRFSPSSCRFSPRQSSLVSSPSSSQH